MTNKHNKEDYVILETINGTLETVHKSELTQVMTHYKGLRIDCLPDLLEALDEMMGLPFADNVRGYKIENALIKASKAIAKARGES